MPKRRPAQSRGKRALLVGTTKGAFVLEAVAGRTRWKARGPWMLGARIHDFRLDPRDGRTLLLLASGGHLGPTVFRSGNGGRTWKEAEKPPAFGRAPKKAPKGDGKTSRGQAIAFNFWLSPGHDSEPGTWYLGASPPGLFRSEDGGGTWEGVKGWNENPLWGTWTLLGQPGSPEGTLLHSVRVDSRDPRHLFLSVSSGGTFESHDKGRSWAPLNKGVDMDFMPGPPPQFGHDVHCMTYAPSDPDVLYQQNHCGIYRMERARTDTWTRIGRKMPKKIGDIGFPIVVHPRDPDVAWVFPMDGTREWPRTSPGGRPAVYRTANGGRSWTRLDSGLPPSDGWFTVKRQCMTIDDARDPAVYFGTTGGEIWGSVRKGGSFACLWRHLPQVYSLSAVRIR